MLERTRNRVATALNQPALLSCGSSLSMNPFPDCGNQRPYQDLHDVYAVMGQISICSEVEFKPVRRLKETKMTESEHAVEELRLALGPIDFMRATRAAIALQETRTIDRVSAERLIVALGNNARYYELISEPIIGCRSPQSLMASGSTNRVDQRLAAFARALLQARQASARRELQPRARRAHLARGYAQARRFSRKLQMRESKTAQVAHEVHETRLAPTRCQAQARQKSGVYRLDC
jgi:hypothetical protein